MVRNRARRAVAQPREAELVNHQRERKRHGKHEQLGARAEREAQPKERERVVSNARRAQRAVAQVDRPDKRGIRDVLRQQGRSQNQPRGEGRERGCGDRSAA